MHPSIFPNVQLAVADQSYRRHSRVGFLRIIISGIHFMVHGILE
ncbi:hypothetical protein BBSC_0128 [Bifidobacterium scardovii JCM 12489 = DSM 13734]|nr:hypothetical protein BBSC_0128 [Bifidobacterium scardovii JCM 12489 = DSM 13734]